jgi:hypothetical protein
VVTRDMSGGKRERNTCSVWWEDLKVGDHLEDRLGCGSKKGKVYLRTDHEDPQRDTSAPHGGA